MEIVIADTGFIVALTNLSDPKHEIVKKCYFNYKTILIPQTVFAEVAYLIGRESGVKTVANFLRGLSKSHFSVIPITSEDILRTADIIEQYSDSRIDFVDATVMAIAKRLNITTILTLDQRDFNLYRPALWESG